MTDRILLIEDDTRLAEMVRDYLGRAGFRVERAASGAAGLAHQAGDTFDAIILDLMLPDMDGLDVCRAIRSRADIPILMLTARGDAMDRVIGLELGADDYLPKPFEPRELLARLRAILRRGQSPAKSDVLRFGRLEIDQGARAVRVDGEAKTLTSYQFALLLVMAEHAGRVMTREALMDLLKAQPLEAFDRSIDVHVSRIRAPSRTIQRSRDASSRYVALATCSRRPRTDAMRRLYHQFYLTIIASLVAVVLAAGALWRFAPSDTPAEQAFVMAGELVSAHLAPLEADLAAQQQAIDQLHPRLGIDLGLFDKSAGLSLRPVAWFRTRRRGAQAEAGSMVAAVRRGQSGCLMSVGSWPDLQSGITAPLRACSASLA